MHYFYIYLTIILLHYIYYFFYIFTIFFISIILLLLTEIQPQSHFIPSEPLTSTASDNNNNNEDIVNEKRYYKYSQNHLGEKSLLFKVCNYCDEYKLPRPTYIITTLKI